MCEIFLVFLEILLVTYFVLSVIDETRVIQALEVCLIYFDA